MVLNVHRNRIRRIRDGEKGGKGVWRWGRKSIYIIYTYRYTVTARMTPALRWAVKSAI